MAQTLPPETMVGHYASWSYLQSLPGKENQSFLRRFRKRYGADRHVNDPMVSAYVGVQLWAQAVAERICQLLSDLGLSSTPAVQHPRKGSYETLTLTAHLLVQAYQPL